MTRQTDNIHWGYLALILPPYLILIALVAILGMFGDPNVPLIVGDPPPDAGLSELTGRYRMLATGVFFGAVSISVLLIFCLSAWHHHGLQVWIRSACAVIFALAAAGWGLKINESWLDTTDFSAIVGWDRFEPFLKAAQASWCKGAACADKGALWVHDKLSDVLDPLTMLSLGVALVGMILALARNADEDVEARATVLRTAHGTIQRHLYLAGLLLSSGVLFMLSWMIWPAQSIADGALRQAYEDLVGAVVLYVGVGFTIVILSVYLPVTLIYRARVERLRAEIAGLTDLGDKEKERLMVPVIEYSEALKAIAAILSPILAGAMGTLGGSIPFA